MSRFLRISLAALVIAVLLAAFGLAQQRSVTIMVLWSGTELEAFEATLKPFEDRTGIDVRVESVGRDLPTILVTRFEAGNPPDMAAMPNPGQMKEFVAEGGLVPLDFLDLSDHPKAFVDLGSVGGRVYGIFISADLKSLVWYNAKIWGKDFSISTWDNLMKFTEGLAAGGKTAWCIGLESGAASGWPGTDWIEDIMLRTAGPDLYDKWVNHEIPWTHPAVKRAFELFGQIARNNAYVFGGTTGVLSTNFGDSPAAMFTTPPGCFLHRQATFIQSFILGAYPNLKPVEDYSIFVFPPIDPARGNPLLGAGDLISAFRDTPEVRELLKYLASAEAQAIWVGKLGKLAINTKVNPAVYPDDITRKAAEILKSAEVFRFDGSDLMPAAVGSGAFWKGVLDYVSGVSLDVVLADIEAAAVAAYGK
jgi:alpha-glucoside transport system substrate-binding protein